MKIVIDDKIPFIRGVFEPFAEIIYAPGMAIDASMVKSAAVLIVRTRTRCDAALLQDSSVKLIATATIGYDHIDTAYCAQKGIQWLNAPGCNAAAVVQYIFSALGHLAKKQGFRLEEKTIGVVGVGNVGGRITAFAKQLGMKVLCNDPPREEREGQQGFASLEQVKEEADIISFHTPLTSKGKYPTYHLCGDRFFFSSMKNPIIINTARGEVCSGEALKRAYRRRQISALVLDCWENEPHIDAELLAMTAIATFHIAGYSLEGKANATTAVVKGVSHFFDFDLNEWRVQLPDNNLDIKSKYSPLEELVDSYPIMNDVRSLKAAPDKFEALRSAYDFRRQPNCLGNAS